MRLRKDDLCLAFFSTTRVRVSARRHEGSGGRSAPGTAARPAPSRRTGHRRSRTARRGAARSSRASAGAPTRALGCADCPTDSGPDLFGRSRDFRS